MQKLLSILLIFVLSLTISGCSVAWNSKVDEIRKNAKEEDYGEIPTNSEEKIKSFMELVAKDPTSLIYRDWSAPEKVIIPAKDTWTSPILGYLISVYVNGKNSYGGYTGFTKYFFIFVNNELYAYSTSRNNIDLKYI